MPADPGVLATFREPGAAAAAIRALRARGFRVRAAMPAPFPEVLQAIGKPRSAIDRVALTGALVGLACGTLLAVATSLAWPLATGGMPIVSAPPFAVVAFETAVLAGSLANLAAVLVAGWRGGRPRIFPDGEALDEGRIGVFAAGGDGAEAERILRVGGADGVRHVG